jgi:hypothetical protein
MFFDTGIWPYTCTGRGMLQKCANPSCVSPFRRLSEGKLFLVERDIPNSAKQPLRRWDDGAPHRIEHFWLCNECASVVTLSFENGKGLTTVPLTQMAKKRQAGSVAVSRDNAERA